MSDDMAWNWPILSQLFGGSFNAVGDFWSKYQMYIIIIIIIIIVVIAAAIFLRIRGR
jgi:uncharacterized membrane protein